MGVGLGGVRSKARVRLGHRSGMVAREKGMEEERDNVGNVR